MKNRKGKPAAGQRILDPDPVEPTSEEVAKAAFQVSRILVYVMIVVLIFTAYVCQKAQFGLFYWPAE